MDRTRVGLRWLLAAGDGEGSADTVGLSSLTARLGSMERSLVRLRGTSQAECGRDAGDIIIGELAKVTNYHQALMRAATACARRR